MNPSTSFSLEPSSVTNVYDYTCDPVKTYSVPTEQLDDAIPRKTIFVAVWGDGTTKKRQQYTLSTVELVPDHESFLHAESYADLLHRKIAHVLVKANEGKAVAKLGSFVSDALKAFDAPFVVKVPAGQILFSVIVPCSKGDHKWQWSWTGNKSGGRNRCPRCSIDSKDWLDYQKALCAKEKNIATIRQGLLFGDEPAGISSIPPLLVSDVSTPLSARSVSHSVMDLAVPDPLHIANLIKKLIYKIIIESAPVSKRLRLKQWLNTIMGRSAGVKQSMFEDGTISEYRVLLCKLVVLQARNQLPSDLSSISPDHWQILSTANTCIMMLHKKRSSNPFEHSVDVLRFYLSTFLFFKYLQKAMPDHMDVYIHNMIAHCPSLKLQYGDLVFGNCSRNEGTFHNMKEVLDACGGHIRLDELLIRMEQALETKCHYSLNSKHVDKLANLQLEKFQFQDLVVPHEFHDSDYEFFCKNLESIYVFSTHRIELDDGSHLYFTAGESFKRLESLGISLVPHHTFADGVKLLKEKLQCTEEDSV